MEVGKAIGDEVSVGEGPGVALKYNNESTVLCYFHFVAESTVHFFKQWSNLKIMALLYYQVLNGMERPVKRWRDDPHG